MNESSRLRIGGVPVDRLTFDQAIDAIDRLVHARAGGAVFTPNADHIVLFHEDPRFKHAYERASLSFADGMPVVWASKLYGRGVPQRVSGSDLVMPLIERAALRGWRVVLLGGAEGIADIAQARMEAAFPAVKIVGKLAPRVDIANPASSYADVIAEVKSFNPDVILVALGSPKQEIWIDQVRDAMGSVVMLGIGASLDFVAGKQKRAPGWVSDAGLEWAYRLAREPRRLWRRYLVRDPKFALIVLRSLREARGGR